MNQDQPINQAIDFFRRGRHDAAEKICTELLRNCPTNLAAHHILGKIAYLKERYEDSVQYLEPIYQANGANAEVVIEFARALRLARRLEDAIACARKALSLGATYSAWLELGLALAEANQPDEAKPALERALELNPRCNFSLRRLGHIARQQGDFAQAIRYYQQLADAYPRTIHSYPDLIKTHLMSGNPQAALDACDRCLTFEPACTGVLAYKYIALCELGESGRAGDLYDHAHLLKRISVAPPAGYSTITEFNDRLSRHILHHTIQSATPERYTTANGWQTQAGTLFQSDPALGTQMTRIIEQAVDTYVEQLPRDTGHPMMAGVPTATHIESWAVVLDEHGHQAPHIHPKSWISGCYYVALPEDFNMQPDPNAGCIAFGQGERELHRLRQPETVVLRPASGDMVLFPSYYWHHTFPLQSKNQRICIAFDVVPTKGWGK
jgi:uncharacterized protein (TIGR02466 family)